MSDAQIEGQELFKMWNKCLKGFGTVAQTENEKQRIIEKIVYGARVNKSIYDLNYELYCIYSVLEEATVWLQWQCMEYEFVE